MAGTPGERAREAYAKARNAAAPKIAKAQAEAGPRAGKAAAKATSVLGQLKDRAKETAQGFTEGYRTDGQDGGTDPQASDGPRRRPRPGPGR
jgi:hypothetical protein